MPEVEFTINSETGEMEMRIEGIKGALCTDVAKLAKEFLGAPAREKNTAEFYIQPQVQKQVQPKNK